ncbi:MAG: hypothetical protein HOV68_13470, partial [Streptomycetaceae bacterium]|nr:hypothetical protein [Streptomycetaceae bacterium]
MTTVREAGAAPAAPQKAPEPEVHLRSVRPAATGLGASRLTSSGRAVAVAGVVCCGLGWGLGYVEALALGIAALAAVAFALAWTHPTPSVRAPREIVPVRVSRDEIA